MPPKRKDKPKPPGGSKPKPKSGGSEKKAGPKLKSPFYPSTLVGEGADRSQLPGFQQTPGMPVQGAYTPNQAPRYQDGMQWEPTNWSPDEVWQLQQALMAAGYAENLTAKVWDEKSASAFKNVLTAANHQGIPWQDIITQGVESEAGYAAAEAESERAPLTVELTSPEDLAASGRGVGQETIGRDPSNEELMQFAAEYQGTERSAQEQAYNMGESGGTVTAPMSPDVAAEEWLRKNRTGEVIATSAAKQAAVFEDLLTNSRWRLSSG